MHAEELFKYALSSLPDAVGELLRDGRDAREFIYASFDGSSALGMALIASDLASELGVEGEAACAEVRRMIQAASDNGEELVVSLMVTKDVLTRIMKASCIDANMCGAVSSWLEAPVTMGHFRVVAIAGDDLRAAIVDGVTALDDAPVSSSMLN